MDKKAIITIVVVLLVIIASVGIYFMVNGDDDDSNHVDVEASLLIMGNANTDAQLTTADVDIIQDIVDGDLRASDYPYADANNDGTVNSDDIQLVKDLIDHKSGLTVNVVCTYNGEDYIQAVPYPLTKVVSSAFDCMTTLVLVGASEYVVAYSSTNCCEAHAPIIENGVLLGGSNNDLNTDESLDKFAEVDTATGGIEAVFTMTGASYLRNGAPYIEAADIPIVRLECSEGFQAITAAVTIGFLFGEECEKRAYNYALDSYEVMEYIDSKVGGLADEDRTTYYAVTMGYYICQQDQQYTKIAEHAGGLCVCPLEGSSTTKIEEGSTYYYQWDADYIFSYRTLDFAVDYYNITNGTTLTPADTWKTYESYYSMLDNYENLTYINYIMPIVCKIAFSAQVMYPELFGDEYGYDVMQEFADKYLEHLGDGDFDVRTDMTCIITYKDIYG